MTEDILWLLMDGVSGLTNAVFAIGRHEKCIEVRTLRQLAGAAPAEDWADCPLGFSDEVY